MNGMNQNNQMKTYNKQHNYKGFEFNIEIILDHQVERHPGGKRLHLIKVNETNSKFVGKEYASSENLANAISETIKSAENWVESMEGKNKTSDDILLEALGFKR
jgi:hypothetical protein